MKTLRELLPLFDGQKRLLADTLGISKQAVSNWDLDKPIPELRFYQLQERRPDLFRVQEDSAA